MPLALGMWPTKPPTHAHHTPNARLAHASPPFLFYLWPPTRSAHALHTPSTRLPHAWHTPCTRHLANSTLTARTAHAQRTHSTRFCTWRSSRPCPPHAYRTPFTRLPHSNHTLTTHISHGAWLRRWWLRNQGFSPQILSTSDGPTTG